MCRETTVRFWNLTICKSIRAKKNKIAICDFFSKQSREKQNIVTATMDASLNATFEGDDEYEDFATSEHAIREEDLGVEFYAAEGNTPITVFDGGLLVSAHTEFSEYPLDADTNTARMQCSLHVEPRTRFYPGEMARHGADEMYEDVALVVIVDQQFDREQMEPVLNRLEREYGRHNGNRSLNYDLLRCDASTSTGLPEAISQAFDLLILRRRLHANAAYTIRNAETLMGHMAQDLLWTTRYCLVIQSDWFGKSNEALVGEALKLGQERFCEVYHLGYGARDTQDSSSQQQQEEDRTDEAYQQRLVGAYYTDRELTLRALERRKEERRRSAAAPPAAAGAPADEEGRESTEEEDEHDGYCESRGEHVWTFHVSTGGRCAGHQAMFHRSASLTKSAASGGRTIAEQMEDFFGHFLWLMSNIVATNVQVYSTGSYQTGGSVYARLTGILTGIADTDVRNRTNAVPLREQQVIEFGATSLGPDDSVCIHPRLPFLADGECFDVLLDYECMLTVQPEVKPWQWEGHATSVALDTITVEYQPTMRTIHPAERHKVIMWRPQSAEHIYFNREEAEYERLIMESDMDVEPVHKSVLSYVSAVDTRSACRRTPVVQRTATVEPWASFRRDFSREGILIDPMVLRARRRMLVLSLLTDIIRIVGPALDNRLKLDEWLRKANAVRELLEEMSEYDWPRDAAECGTERHDTFATGLTKCVAQMLAFCRKCQSWDTVTRAMVVFDLAHTFEEVRNAVERGVSAFVPHSVASPALRNIMMPQPAIQWMNELYLRRERRELG
jgi:hypothetical protein